MPEIVDVRYGDRGRGVWFLLPAPFVFAAVVLWLFYVTWQLISLQAPVVLVISVCATFFAIYFFCMSVQFLVEAPKVAQHLSWNGVLDARLYFGRRINVKIDEVSRVDAFRLRRLYTLTTLLSFSGENLRVEMTNGQVFYVAGELVGVGDFLSAVKPALSRV